MDRASSRAQMLRGFVNSSLQKTLIGHDREAQSAAFSPDGTRIVTASGDGTAKLWALDLIHSKDVAEQVEIAWIARAKLALIALFSKTAASIRCLAIFSPSSTILKKAGALVIKGVSANG